MRFLSERRIKLDRELSELDKFVLSFAKTLQDIKYVAVSGYVSILFGRSRATEDIDLLIERISEERFNLFFKNALKQGFECFNSSQSSEALQMLREHAIRFARKGKAIPNIEFKMIKNSFEKEVLDNSLIVEMNHSELKISSIEIQIAFKKFVLGSEKDLEDARHLEIVFKDKINTGKLKKYSVLLKKYA